MNPIINRLGESLKTGFIDKSYLSSKDYLPQLLVNNKNEQKKILTTILKELNNCDEFWFSVAFVTTSGVATLINTLQELREKGVKGKILVSQYLNFTQPEALRRLLKFENIEVKIAIDTNFHSKGYLFKKGDLYDLIIGSSNLTAAALCSNAEWNLKVTATPSSDLIFNAIKEFTATYEEAVIVDTQFIQKYEASYNAQLESIKVLKSELVNNNLVDSLKPNLMQREALSNLEMMRSNGQNKALLISATGTGKTYLSAFDAKKTNPKRLLFIVHRLNIAEASKKSYERVFGNTKSYGVYSGGRKEIESDFVFSTIQTLTKEDNLAQFSRDHFDYIVIDETHRSGADSYKRVLEYFEPKFLLGMTATPERTDGLDIFKQFDYNIAYEIRLHRALEEDMLCPFHYYGVTDLSVNGIMLEETSEFRFLTASERIDRIIEKAKFYGCCTDEIRGLIFCSSTDECKQLSLGFNQRGYRTTALTSSSSEKERSEAIEKLESNDIKSRLHYIFTVDIFNEGVDIPTVNQVIMLRPTQSAIIFVQQLGRGLRKIENKDYLTVIDFIGNYKNNFLVPIALYGDTSYNKDTLRKLMASGSRLIPGTSTINFDKISRDRIYESIDTAKLTLRRDLTNDYNYLKSKLGRIPMMVDFLEHGSRDPLHYVDIFKSYFNFISSVENSFVNKLSDSEKTILELFSSEINNAKRVEECVLLSLLIDAPNIKVTEFELKILRDFEYQITSETILSCISNLNFEFVRKPHQIAKLNGNNILLCSDLEKALDNPTFKEFLIDSTNCSIQIFRKGYSKSKLIDGLILYNKYSRKDVCRILNWPKDVSSTVYGYRTYNESTPCFVTYHKSDTISETTNYNDHFIDQSTFAWESRSNRKIDSQEIQNVIQSKRILLFVKKEDGEGSDFYYLGDATIIEGSIEQRKMKDSNSPVVHFKFSLKTPVEDSIYEYITKNKESINVNIKEEVSNLSNKETKLPFRILEPSEANPYVNSIPLYDIKVAAGNFSDQQINHECEWVKLNSTFKYSSDYFICKITGESMNQIIPNDSWCLFKKYFGGSREGKIVLVKHTDIQDSDFGSGYTVKSYHSEKEYIDGVPYNKSISLNPKSYNQDYKPIILQEDESKNLIVLGIFHSVLA